MRGKSIALAGALFAAGALSAVASVPAAGQVAVAARAEPSSFAPEVTTLADQVASEWARPGSGGLLRSTRNGRIERDPGQAMLAYGLLRAADRTGNQRLAGVANGTVAGARVRQPDGFEQMSYSRILGDPRTAALLSPGATSAASSYAQSFARPYVGPRARPCADNPRCYNNLKLVDATSTLLLLGAGVEGGKPGAKLSRREAERSKALATITSRAPSAAPGGASWHSGSESRSGVTLLSDPHPNPLAYQSLSAGMLAQDLDLLSPSARGAVTSLLRRMLGYSVGFVAPDGDITYMGRGQQQIWTQAASLYAALTGARLFASSDRRLAGELLSLARLNLDRIQIAHRQMGSRGGLAVVPEPRPDYRGVDHYASHTSYNGLALYFLNLAVDAAAKLPDDASLAPITLPSLRPEGISFRDPRGARIFALRRGDVWIAVHTAQTHKVDLRYDWGLVAAKRRDSDGQWRDLIPARPIREGEGLPAETVGPSLADPGGHIRARPLMSAASFAGGGIRLTGHLVGASSRRVSFTFGIAGRGIEVSWPSSPGDRWRFLALSAKARRGGGRVLRAATGSWHLASGSRIRPYPKRLHSAPNPNLFGYLVLWTPHGSRTGISVR